MLRVSKNVAKWLVSQLMGVSIYCGMFMIIVLRFV